MKKIEHPEFRIIRTMPSTLGTVDYYIIIYEKLDFNDSNLLEGKNEAEIAENIYESGVYQGFYVIHSSTTRGEEIDILNQGKKLFCYNRINCDSILSYHCLVIKADETSLKLRTGFHEIQPEMNISETIYDWNSMMKISNGYQEIEVNRDTFFKLYEEQVEVWKTQITTYIKPS